MAAIEAAFSPARPPPPIIQFHGTIFLGWLLLLTLQATLAARHRQALRMRVGKCRSSVWSST